LGVQDVLGQAAIFLLIVQISTLSFSPVTI